LSYDAAKPIEKLYSSNGIKPKHIEILYPIAGSSSVASAKELVITNLPKLPEQLKG
jgi:hypothetical protein